jgi:hypothetical protein
MIKELEPVVLTQSRPGAGITSGRVGWVVMIDAGGAGYEIEFVTLAGKKSRSRPRRLRPQLNSALEKV